MTKHTFIPSIVLFNLMLMSNAHALTDSEFNLAANSVIAPEIETAINHSISMDFLMGHYRPEKQANFTLISSRYASRKGMYLQKESYSAFKTMARAAKRQGIRLIIRSATRNYQQQKVIWEAKWTGKRRVGPYKNITKHIKNKQQRALKILEYSSMPGTSRHHWGTDIDLNSFNNSYFNQGKGKKIYQWLVNNAAQYGFCQPYTPKNADRPYGYNEEKWHWSYKPLAQQYLTQMNLRADDSMIQGFKGAEVANTIEVVNKYILGVDLSCY